MNKIFKNMIETYEMYKQKFKIDYRFTSAHYKKRNVSHARNGVGRGALCSRKQL